MISLMSRETEQTLLQYTELMDSWYSSKEDKQIEALAILGTWRDLRVLKPILLGCVSGDNRGQDVRPRALEALDSINVWIQSAAVPTNDVNRHKRAAFQTACRKAGGGADKQYEELGKHGVPQDVEWLLPELANTEFSAAAVNYLKGLLTVKAAQMPSEVLQQLASVERIQVRLTSTDRGSVYDSRISTVDCSELHKLAQSEINKRQNA
jgi:hypothetical protein